MKKGLLIVVSSPSGGGKGSVLAKLLEQNKNMSVSVSATTRGPREGEKNAVHYHFMSKKEFLNLVESGQMLEYAQFCENYYGTPKAPVMEALQAGKDIILEIEVQGGAQIKKIMPECVSIFIAPPSLEILEKRLRGRGTEDEETILKRLNTAKEELEKTGDYDYVVVNDVLEDAVAEIKDIIEKLKNT